MIKIKPKTTQWTKSEQKATKINHFTHFLMRKMVAKLNFERHCANKIPFTLKVFIQYLNFSPTFWTLDWDRSIAITFPQLLPWGDDSFDLSKYATCPTFPPGAAHMSKTKSGGEASKTWAQTREGKFWAKYMDEGKLWSDGCCLCRVSMASPLVSFALILPNMSSLLTFKIPCPTNGNVAKFLFKNSKLHLKPLKRNWIWL